MTHLYIVNETDTDVTAYITLGATAGCVQDVSKLIMGDHVTITKLSDLQGHFPLKAHARVSMAAPNGEGLNGNLSINTPPLNCPTPEFPFGVNLAEFIINNGFQVNGQETVDISGVCGTNAFLRFTLSADDWVANTETPVHIFENNVWDANSDLVGVFPYGCDVCTGSVNPPDCVGLQPQNANAEPICNVQRSAATNQGGAVVVSFHGMTPVPLS